MIIDLEGYLSRMEISAKDKLFFLNKIDMNEVDTIVDFGCADGTLIRILNSIYPNKNYIGYDTCEEMKEKFYEKNSLEVGFISDFDYLCEFVGGKKNVLLIFSSVLHELYSYLAPDEAKRQWETIISLDSVKYVAIRDMHLERASFQDGVRGFFLAMSNEPEQFSDYVKHRNCNDVSTVIEYFLKYRYVENWERERDEKYFYDLNFFKIPDNFKVIFEDFFNIAPQIENIKNHFELDLSHITTHYKRILKK